MQAQKISTRKNSALCSDPLRIAARRVAKVLRQAGYDTRFAGGCVRDRLLGRPVKDIDIATQAPPEVVERLFDKTVAVGKAFGVIRVLEEGFVFEVATFRADVGIGDGRRPASVQYATAEADAQRRDFTINALFEDPDSGAISDYVGGLADLAAGVIRAIGAPTLRFREDRLRLLRAVRFAAVLDFRLEATTAEAMRQAAPLINQVSGERRGDELTRMLTEAPRPGAMLHDLQALGLLSALLPEIAAMRGVPQPPRFHPEGDVFVHTALMLDALPSPPRDPVLTYATLLHDVGKPPAAMAPSDGDPDGWRFPNHAGIGAKLAVALLTRLKRPSALIQAVADIVRRHMTFPDLPNMRPARQRRFMGAPTFERECELLRLDSLCSGGDLTLYRKTMARRAALAAEPVLPEPWIRGRDLLALGLKPGPALGDWLRRAYDAQLEGTAANRDDLLAWVRKMTR